MTARSRSSSRNRLDLATCTGLLVCFCGVLGGLLLEGGKLLDVSQLTAAVIVLGGTIGAVMVTTPTHALVGAVKKVPSIFWLSSYSIDEAISCFARLSAKARHSGVLSLEDDIESLPDPFMRKALTLLVDGVDLKLIREIMAIEITTIQHHGDAEAKVFEVAAGYAPTVGIIGAVMGLIQVMKHLDNLHTVGHGIAVAFVATIYGVALANIFFLPAANKLKAKLQIALQMKEMALEAVQAIAEGMNPLLVTAKLEAYRQPFDTPLRSGARVGGSQASREAVGTP